MLESAEIPVPYSRAEPITEPPQGDRPYQTLVTVPASTGATENQNPEPFDPAATGAMNVVRATMRAEHEHPHRSTVWVHSTVARTLQ